jgi:hypothetical protein
MDIEPVHPEVINYLKDKDFLKNIAIIPFAY